MDELIVLVKEWGKERNIHQGEPRDQYLKVAEEVGEIAAALSRNDMPEIKDAIGDSIVTLIMLAMQLDLEIYDCLIVAYSEIKDRKGKTINGVFVKEGDF